MSALKYSYLLTYSSGVDIASLTLTVDVVETLL